MRTITFTICKWLFHMTALHIHTQIYMNIHIYANTQSFI